MKLLIITNLFPNNKEPTRGIFNKQQFLELAKLCELKVIAPLPWHYRRDIPKEEIMENIEIYHPRYLMIPKLGRSLYGLFFYLSLGKFVKKIQNDFNFDLILATWAYPDGFGSYLIARALNKPIVIKVHGSDININTKHWLRRKMVSYALKNSNGVFSVSNALKERMVDIGVPKDKISVITNGVDTDLFKPMNQKECREKLNLLVNKKIILFVGNLVPVKGVDYLISAFSKVVATGLTDLRLVIIGEGPLKEKLLQETKTKNIHAIIDFVGKKPHAEIPYWMNAADLFCLPSHSEGCPNVLLEAIACQRPIVASNIRGISDLVSSSQNKVLFKPGNSDELGRGILNILNKPQIQNDVINNNFSISWAQNAKNMFNIINSLQSQ